jgi:hypothetical protein
MRKFPREREEEEEMYREIEENEGLPRHVCLTSKEHSLFYDCDIILARRIQEWFCSTIFCDDYLNEYNGNFLNVELFQEKSTRKFIDLTRKCTSYVRKMEEDGLFPKDNEKPIPLEFSECQKEVNERINKVALLRRIYYICFFSVLYDLISFSTSMELWCCIILILYGWNYLNLASYSLFIQVWMIVCVRFLKEISWYERPFSSCRVVSDYILPQVLAFPVS